MNNLAHCYWLLKRLDKSVPLFEELLLKKEKKLGRKHAETQLAVGNLGATYKDADRLTEAIPLLDEAYGASSKFPTLKAFGPQLLNAYKKARLCFCFKICVVLRNLRIMSFNFLSTDYTDFRRGRCGSGSDV